MQSLGKKSQRGSIHSEYSELKEEIKKDNNEGRPKKTRTVRHLYVDETMKSQEVEEGGKSKSVPRMDPNSTARKPYKRVSMLAVDDPPPAAELTAPKKKEHLDKPPVRNNFMFSGTK